MFLYIFMLFFVDCLIQDSDANTDEEEDPTLEEVFNNFIFNFNLKCNQSDDDEVVFDIGSKNSQKKVETNLNIIKEDNKKKPFKKIEKPEEASDDESDPEKKKNIDKVFQKRNRNETVEEKEERKKRIKEFKLERKEKKKNFKNQFEVI